MVDTFVVEPKRGDNYKTTDFMRPMNGIFANGLVPGVGNQFNIIDQVSPPLDVKIDTGRCILDGISVELTVLSDAKSLTDAATNHIWIELDINAGGRVIGGKITINTTGTEPTDPFVKIGEVVTAAGDITSINQVKLGVGWLAEIGEIRAFGTTDALIPLGWLRCDDAAIGRTLYKRLFDKISTNFGVGDGSTTFNVPLLNDKFPRGRTGTANPGSEGGADTHQLTAGESGVKAHNHGISPNPHSHLYRAATPNGSGNQQLTIADSNATADVSTVTTSLTVNNNTAAGADSAHENKPAFQAVIYAIKA